MEQHAVPREVTSFEFKLIGYFTIKQFAYLLISASFGVFTYVITIIPYLNIFMGVVVFSIGAVFSLYKHNERPLDVWLKNLVVSLLSPSQYYYHKNNPVPGFLMDVYFSDVTVSQTHVDASQKLNKYIAGTGASSQTTDQTQNINTLISTTKVPSQPTVKDLSQDARKTPSGSAQPQSGQPQSAQPQGDDVSESALKKPTPFFSGVIRNKKDEPVPGIMVYLNFDSGQPARILKTNHNGVFATFHPLPSGTYSIVPKDLGGRYFFDTMNLVVDGSSIQPVDIYSKEVL